MKRVIEDLREQYKEAYQIRRLLEGIANYDTDIKAEFEDRDSWISECDVSEFLYFKSRLDSFPGIVRKAALLPRYAPRWDRFEDRVKTVVTLVSVGRKEYEIRPLPISKRKNEG